MRPIKSIYCIIGFILISDIFISFNIPILRQISGFFLLTVLPGFLILRLLNLRARLLKMLVLSWGLSISFLMLFGLSLNAICTNIGYGKPLGVTALLVSLNIIFIVLSGYTHTDDLFDLFKASLSVKEKATLVIPAAFPLLAIVGIYQMNLFSNNLLLIGLLALIASYVALACLLHDEFTKATYPLLICLISISILLLFSLRTNHLVGMDTHREYFYFLNTLHNLYWVNSRDSTLVATLSISLLPTIYQSILNINTEYLFKILYSIIYSIAPVAIYLTLNKYLQDVYAFIGSCFFMFQQSFLITSMNARTSMATLLFILSIMVIFDDSIDKLNRQILFIFFTIASILSHYSTTYIYFLILLCTFLAQEILDNFFTFEKKINKGFLVLFFVAIFLWYSQITEMPFNAGVKFFENTIHQLGDMLISESRSDQVYTVLGSGIASKGVPYKLEFFFTWATFAFICIGTTLSLIKLKKLSFPENELEKASYSGDKVDILYLIMAEVCVSLLFIILILPYLSRGYSLDRLYSMAITLLSLFFVMGGIYVSGLVEFILNKFNKQWSFNKDLVRICVILLVLIPYFFSVTGFTYNLFDTPQSMILNSEGRQYNILAVHDTECFSAKWLGGYGDNNKQIYADCEGTRLISQGEIPGTRINSRWLSNPVGIKGYIYLRQYNVHDGMLVDSSSGSTYNLSAFSRVLSTKNKIYNDLGSEIFF